MRLAILADIHGNSFALEAVAAQLEKLQPDDVIVNGDIINATPFSGEVIDFLRNKDWRVIRGNHEFYYLDFAGGRAPDSWQSAERWGQLHWLMEQLSPDQGAYLAALPDLLSLYYPTAEPLLVTHGVPGNNRMGFIERTSDETILGGISQVQQQTFVNAHSHVQIDRMVNEQAISASEGPADPLAFLDKTSAPPTRVWHVINPGSVGLPLNGDVRAQFAVLESVSPDEIPGGWRVSHYRVPYDRRPVLEAFISRGMLEAGGVISELFYWELVTAEREIPYFFIWRRNNLSEDGLSFEEEFQAYKRATGRDAYVRAQDPLRSTS